LAGNPPAPPISHQSAPKQAQEEGKIEDSSEEDSDSETTIVHSTRKPGRKSNS